MDGGIQHPQTGGEEKPHKNFYGRSWAARLGNHVDRILAPPHLAYPSPCSHNHHRCPHSGGTLKDEETHRRTQTGDQAALRRIPLSV